jgi:hypothetical protein
MRMLNFFSYVCLRFLRSSLIMHANRWNLVYCCCYKYFQFEVREAMIFSCNFLSSGLSLCVTHQKCTVEYSSWASDSGLFIQHGGKTGSIVNNAARLLHCTEHMTQKRVHCMHKINTQWPPIIGLSMYAQFSIRLRSSRLLLWTCGRSVLDYMFNAVWWARFHFYCIILAYLILITTYIFVYFDLTFILKA